MVIGFFHWARLSIRTSSVPKISHLNLAKAAVITERWAKANGLPYITVGYWEGLCDATRFIRDGWTYEPIEQSGSRAGE